MFKGTYTAIITPFKEDGEIDQEALEKLIDFNIDNGVSGFVPCGTTGESPTLSPDEHSKVIDIVIKHVAGRVPIIAGTGSNCTKEAIYLSQHAEKAGVDALLLVNPYYNKPTQEGLYRHFKAISDNVKIPCILYNIKGRTGVNLETTTLLRLINDCKNIVGVKEASGDMEQIKQVIKQTPNNFSVLSGDDNIALELIKNGGQGVISVISNLVPDKMSKIIELGLKGEFEEAEKINKFLEKLMEAEFIETNPIPIKYMLSLQKRCKEVYRLPLCELSEEHKNDIKQLLDQMGLV
jgi:4-hydroxy-tetrahydrodipicolinate synthase